MDESRDAKSPSQPASEAPAGSQLPVVWSPPLSSGAGADVPMHAAEAISSSGESAHDEPAEPSPDSATAPAPSQHSRFMLLAACVAIAAAIGAVAGSLSAAGLAHVMYGARASGGMSEASAAQATQATQAVKAELAELAALKANLDSAAKAANGQFAKLSDRLDRVERAEAEPSAKIAHIADAIDRLEKRSVAAQETTGSIASSAAAAPSSDARMSEPIVPNWIVQDVRGNRALVASRYHGLYAVAAGSVLPGLGRVESIARQNGQWVVVTESGVIASAR